MQHGERPNNNEKVSARLEQKQKYPAIDDLHPQHDRRLLQKILANVWNFIGYFYEHFINY
jgi:hypothetical protein